MFEKMIGKTIEKVVHNDDDVMNESLVVYFTDGTTCFISTIGGETITEEGWSEIKCVCE